MLRSCDGPGFMVLAPAAADEDQRPYLEVGDQPITDLKDLMPLMPPESIEHDFRGRTTFQPGNFAALECGEIEWGCSSGMPGGGTEQLGICLSIQAYTFKHMFGVPSDKIICVGRLFIPRRQLQQQSISELRESSW